MNEPENERTPGREGGGEGEREDVAFALRKQQEAEGVSVRHGDHCSTSAERYDGENMTSQQSRRGAPRRRRTRPSEPHDRDHVNTSNLTSINALPPVEAPTGFADLGVPPRIDEGLAACGFAQPFNIQTEAIPVAMLGHDVCGRAKTGSGKTLAFGVPMLARITDTGGCIFVAVSHPIITSGLFLPGDPNQTFAMGEYLRPMSHVLNLQRLNWQTFETSGLRRFRRSAQSRCLFWSLRSSTRMVSAREASAS